MTSAEGTVGLPEGEPENWRIVVDSIGEADASLIKALKKITPVPETHLASLIYRAPSQLMDGLVRHTAEALNEMLVEAGLDSRVVDAETSFEPGDDSHDLALVVRDVTRMNEVMMLVVRVLGVDPPTARKILCSSPTVLMGKVSANTVEAVGRRFAALDVEVLASRSEEALFDLFLGACSVTERNLAIRTLREQGIDADEAEATEQPLLAAGLTREQTDVVWQRLQRTSVPLRVINRDFETFDVRLTSAPETPEMVELLTTTTGMPESVAHKVLRNLPVVIHSGIGFARMTDCLGEVTRRGGEADLLLTKAPDILPPSPESRFVIVQPETVNRMPGGVRGLRSGPYESWRE